MRLVFTFLFLVSVFFLYAQKDSVKNFVMVNDISIIGNKVTKRHIILREIPFHPGDTIGKADLPQLLKHAKQNLLNTSLFNFVTIDTIPIAEKKINVLVQVAERWYTWPAPVFEVQERNFNVWWQTKNFARANYGFYLNRENFRGRKEELSFYAQFGYTQKYGLSYKIPYLNKKQTSGLGFGFSYSHNHEVYYGTVDNRIIYFKDANKYVRKELIGKLNYSYRDGIYITHLLETKYVNASIADTLINNYTLDYFLGTNTQIEYFSLDYFLTDDHRDVQAYPLHGYYLSFQLQKLGIGILKNEKLDVINFYTSYKKFSKLSNRFYFAGSMRIKFSPTTTYEPYYVNRGLGWGDYVRSYEYYVIDGQRYGLAKMGLKYEIIKPHIKSVPVPMQKFNTFHYALYGGIFADGGYADDRQYSLVNPLANTFLYGAGVGIDYVTYYDIVIRFEYSINRKLEHGFFLHFNAGI